jgi:hypothetical protein
MPTISIDTFIACSLMVLIVLTAMANTSKLLYPYINNNVDAANIAQRYMQISEYILLTAGVPSDWGKSASAIPETFGLAKTDFDALYDLDIDKVSRLNSKNLYALSYAQAFSALGIPEASFRIEIKPIFDINISLMAIYTAAEETTYQFEILTEKNGVPVKTELKFYVIADDYMNVDYTVITNGETQLNITLPNNVGGPALLVAFAKASSNVKAVSFKAYAFSHNSPEPQSEGAFLKLSPLNHNLTASFFNSELNLSKAYALTFNYHSVLTQISNDNQSVVYEIPCFVDAGPIILAVSGWNSSTFFTEWIAYPQVPLQFGADFPNLNVLSEVFAYTYIVTIDSALYECTVWLGGPRS